MREVGTSGHKHGYSPHVSRGRLSSVGWPWVWTVPANSLAAVSVVPGGISVHADVLADLASGK